MPPKDEHARGAAGLTRQSAHEFIVTLLLHDACSHDYHGTIAISAISAKMSGPEGLTRGAKMLRCQLKVIHVIDLED